MTRTLEGAIESVLFVAQLPVTLDELCEVTSAKKSEVTEALERIGARLQTGSGLQLVRIAGGYQLCTRREYADSVAKYLKPQKRKLTRSALEVLAIVAYRQPITGLDIQVIRGVQSEHAIRTLVDRGLIAEIGRKNSPGRPILYGTTQEFLHHFKLNDLSELPPVEGAEGLQEIGA
ncbi:MAG: Segregation and condensation protein B [Fimbriimonadales bacterium]|nr:MAG: SMC-Scp complex subunit ScpB [Armatimonadota bacterium]MBV6502017.1 Segregation and condensation protein B [Fimbriimonadales bacterium]MCE7898853.1 SMC-Scp complex subunit ScpB [Armatimonadetes bacterium ATM1]MDL1928917.1 SMC-Scp complex subunit ScpB [Fimbriimonadia bacterium ATM]MBC6969584.1 SMC-Scp complex subunit ScpB [Armatimonadota bacterium]